jgi:hypothetical protein
MKLLFAALLMAAMFGSSIAYGQEESGDENSSATTVPDGDESASVKPIDNEIEGAADAEAINDQGDSFGQLNQLMQFGRQLQMQNVQNQQQIEAAKLQRAIDAARAAPPPRPQPAPVPILRPSPSTAGGNNNGYNDTRPGF